MSASKKSTVVALVAIALVIVVVLLARSRHHDERNGGGATADTSGASDPSSNSATPSPGTTPKRSRPGLERPVPYSADIDMQEVLDRYKAQTRFPPRSRPLTKGQVDLLRPNVRHEGPLPARTLKRGDQPDAENDHYFLFTGDHYFLTGTESTTTTLKVWKGRKVGKGYAVPILSATVTAPGGGVRDIVYERRADAGGGVSYANTFSPVNVGLEAHGRYQINITFKDGGGNLVRAHIRFFYTPVGSVPAVFTGAFSERIENGSLVVGAELDVKRPGQYFVMANLFTKAGAPVASTRFIGNLVAGKQPADLMFFGLLFHDQKVSGKFVVKDLRGYRFLRGKNPDRETIPMYNGAFETKSYSLSAFSDATYDSPQKQAKIKLYERLIRNQGSRP